MPTVRYLHRGDPVEVTLTRQPDGTFLARVGEETLTVRVSAAGLDAFRIVPVDGDRAGQAVIVHAAADGPGRHITIDGEAVTLLRDLRSHTQILRRVSVDKGGDWPRLCTAGMPGQVRAVLVSVGDHVERGQPLLVLEAMKMEQKVAAPATGRVAEVRVRVGEVVERGHILVALAAPE